MKAKNILKNIAVSVCIMVAAFFLSVLFQNLKVGEHITTVFVFAVFLISLITDGYVYGIVSAILGMFAINYAFTYPFFAFDFMIRINLISAIIMIIISILTSMLMTKVKYQEAIKSETEKERMRASLLRAISHDLRTPLTTIYSASSTLRDKRHLLTEEQQTAMLQNISEDSEWLIHMVENLLSVTRIDNETMKIQKTPTIVDELVDSVMTKFLNRHSDVDVTIDVPEEIIVVSIDPILIEQVLINILENAVFHAKGMTELVFKITSAGDRAVFEIYDNGCGIREDKLKHIFTGCYETQSDISDGDKRFAGIGLSVCAAIIKAHGSTITAENRKSGGALFRFSLEREQMTEDE